MCQDNKESQQQFTVLEAQLTESNETCSKLQNQLQSHIAENNETIKKLKEELDAQSSVRKEAEKKLIEYQTKLKVVMEDVDAYNKQVVNQEQLHIKQQQEWGVEKQKLTESVNSTQRELDSIKDKNHDLEEKLHLEEARSNG